MDRPSVLVVDDDPGLRDLVRTLLEEEVEATIAEAASWREALPLLAERGPALVLVEVSPGHGGLNLVWHLRSEARLAATRVVAFGFDHECRSKAMAAGADAWLTKPFADDALLQVIRSHLPGGGDSAR